MTPSLINDLCERYERNRDSYRSDAYNEAQARQEFINPLFKLLGWDMDNEQGYAEAYKDVVHEDAIRIGGAIKAPDYSFRIGGQRKFFLEAKKPRVSVVDQKDPAYQLRRYAWSAKLPLSILTNFSELAVYDCRYRPEVGEAAGKHRVEYFTYESYAEKWEYLVNTFSREAILKGSFDKYAQGMKGKRGTQEVDSEFLKEIELWRDILAKNLKLRNKDLSIEALNFSVGRIIDRIIFLRVCEDRGIEEYGQLEKLLQGAGIYEQLVKLFKRADERYNSGLFHFQKEKGRGEQPDTLTLGLTVDDKILKDVFRTLYYPQSPYEFRVFPADILGQVYEQFLGKVIIKSGRSVEVEEKPEVRKAGGVYYTPTYIVDYIVKHTVGKLVEGKTPDEVSKLRVLDPACGSGSFLIGAYQYLLDWHLGEYTRTVAIAGLETHNGETKKARGNKNLPIYETPAGWRLTLAERKRILLNNIYGVDIDGQAVEVTKLSLLLKVLEGSNAAEVQGELSLRHHALPDLGENIKCGNSLYPFEWAREFPSTFREGGFDAIIGNPPYIKEYTSREPFEQFKNSKIGKYYQGKMDIWYAFACLSIDILKEHGLHSFIATNNWLTNAGASILRGKISMECNLLRMIDFGDYKVFKDAGIQTAVYVLEKRRPSDNVAVHYQRVDHAKAEETEIVSFLSEYGGEHIGVTLDTTQPKSNGDAPFTFSSKAIDLLLDKIESIGSVRLADKEVGTGIDVHQDFVTKKHVLQLPKGTSSIGDGIFVLSDSEKKALKLSQKELSLLKPYYTTRELMRFWGNEQNKYWVIYTTTESAKQIDSFPKIKAHFDKFKRIITSDNAPYGLHRAREQRLFEGQKVISLRKTSYPCFTYTDFPCYVSQTYFCIKPENIDCKYLTGILNSRVSYFWLRHRGKMQGDALQIDKEPLCRIPIRTINFKDKADKARHDKMVKLVEQMLELNKKLPEVKTPNEREKLERQIAATDREIDELVYELYNLTPEEIEIVEGKG